MSEEDKLNKKVAEAVEVAANEAAKREIDELTEFEHAVDEMLASGYLDDKASDSNKLELFVAVEQGSRHDVGRGEEQVDGQELAQRP